MTLPIIDNIWLALIAGLLILIASGDFLVKSSVSIAGHLKVPKLVIGLTIVAFGTSAPELLVSLKANLGDNPHPQIALGNVIGSNIANIALVLGITAMLIKIPIKAKNLFFDIIFMLSISILFSVLAWNSTITMLQGIMMLILLVAYLFYKFRQKEVLEDQESAYGLIPSVLLLLLSAYALSYGADNLVFGATGIAIKLGVSEKVVSISMIAIGTSLPELAASVISALKKQTDISIGNIVGSNIFNLLAVMGITTTIAPITEYSLTFRADLVWMLAISLVLLLLLIPYKNNFEAFKKSRKWSGLVSINGGYLNANRGVFLFLLYITYVVLLFI